MDLRWHREEDREQHAEAGDLNLLVYANFSAHERQQTSLWLGSPHRLYFWTNSFFAMSCPNIRRYPSRIQTVAYVLGPVGQFDIVPI
jgi:hypothetical protein